MPENYMDAIKTQFTDMRHGNRHVSDMCINELPLAMAYVPMQKWRKIYKNEVALERGTIFKELDLPFLGDRRISK